MIQAFEEMLDGTCTEEKKEKVLEHINNMDGEGVFAAITEGFAAGNTTIHGVDRFIGYLVRNNILTRKMFLDFTMKKCIEIQMSEDKIPMLKAHLLADFNIDQQLIGNLWNPLYS
jgi:hypothetical protein